MEEIYRSQFRLPYSLYEDLKKSADANRRSVNAELVARLEESFLVPTGFQKPQKIWQALALLSEICEEKGVHYEVRIGKNGEEDKEGGES